MENKTMTRIGGKSKHKAPTKEKQEKSREWIVRTQ
jgi:hypothetical protein